ncbi:cytosolic endo-beta-N-acetylglucosaminidase 1 isoform X2 [Pseudomyrmex gracilis]|uniref:cytosolic endo-beta-N-acetylglucosaminidase 1 isoform X2 n=1 Tax=Pseudomyrmex gracilis TaxID=219809 RepID=UPI0009949BF4|nr:cytosolic endo-beta-N-acetylglucosaminidase 1 isoform X2 [Pseudomyrmex gracilis]
MSSSNQVTESRPFNTLQELYDAFDNGPDRSWTGHGMPAVYIAESTDYVYRGSEINSGNIPLEKVDREDQPRTLVCHDMKGGYLEDRFLWGSTSHDSYVFYHWNVVDTFVYFSHHFVTIPPYGWIKAAHQHGVKVLGTVITEGNNDTWDKILVSREETRRFANILYLTESIHKEIEDSEIIWYDSVTKNGDLNWQNELNDNNKDFFLNCDGIFLNYTWTELQLSNSHALAKNLGRNIKDIYVGLDVWGRGCPGGGGFNSAYALNLIRKHDLSVAIFAPGWTHEYFGPGTFQTLEDLFWAQLFPYLYVHVPIYDNETFKTSFCRGAGVCYYYNGEEHFEPYMMNGERTREKKAFYNLRMQQSQLSVPVPHLQFTQSTRRVIENNEDDERNNDNRGDGDSKKVQKRIERVYENVRNVIRVIDNLVSFEDKSPVPNVNTFEFCNEFSYKGGGCLKLTTRDYRLYHRLFLVHIDFKQDIQATIVYTGFETNALEDDSRKDPVLVVGNNGNLKSILPYESVRINKWKKCTYLTNLRIVEEIGVSFQVDCDCYLGEIVLEKRDQRFDNCDPAYITSRISNYHIQRSASNSTERDRSPSQELDRKSPTV